MIFLFHTNLDVSRKAYFVSKALSQKKKTSFKMYSLLSNDKLNIVKFSRVISSIIKSSLLLILCYTYFESLFKFQKNAFICHAKQN